MIVVTNPIDTMPVLLSEGSVADAARRLRLGPSAMSRSLARLREVTGDPLLVRAGRGLVPTPRAVELRAQVGALVDGANAALRPSERLDLGKLSRRFILRTSEGFVETFGPRLLTITGEQAPGVTLHFLTKPDKKSAPLREGGVDVETGVVDSATAPELCAVSLFDDRWVGVVRADHPLTRAPMTVGRFAASRHVLVLRPGLHSAEVDEAVRVAGLARRIARGERLFGCPCPCARDRACRHRARAPHRGAAHRQAQLFAAG